jgi:hypothetical protein
LIATMLCLWSSDKQLSLFHPWLWRIHVLLGENDIRIKKFSMIGLTL